MKIAMLTFECDPGNWRKIGNPNKQKYCDKHGYDFISYDQKLDHPRHPSWHKIPYMQQTLPNYDWVFWADSDSFVINSDVKIEDFIDDNKDAVFCKDDMGINAGMFMFKNSEWSFWLLEEIWNFKKYGNNKHGTVEMILGDHFGKLAGQKSVFDAWEQTNLRSIVGLNGEKYLDNLKIYEEDDAHFNVRSDRVNKDTFMVHYRRGWREEDGYGHILNMIY